MVTVEVDVSEYDVVDQIATPVLINELASRKLTRTEAADFADKIEAETLFGILRAIQAPPEAVEMILSHLQAPVADHNRLKRWNNWARGMFQAGDLPKYGVYPV